MSGYLLGPRLVTLNGIKQDDCQYEGSKGFFWLYKCLAGSNTKVLSSQNTFPSFLSALCNSICVNYRMKNVVMFTKDSNLGSRHSVYFWLVWTSIRRKSLIFMKKSKNNFFERKCLEIIAFYLLKCFGAGQTLSNLAKNGEWFWHVIFGHVSFLVF